MFVQKKTGKVGKPGGQDADQAVLYFVGKGGSSTLEEHMAEVATALKFYSMYYGASNLVSV